MDKKEIIDLAAFKDSVRSSCYSSRDKGKAQKASGELHVDKRFERTVRWSIILVGAWPPGNE